MRPLSVPHVCLLVLLTACSSDDERPRAVLDASTDSPPGKPDAGRPPPPSRDASADVSLPPPVPEASVPDAAGPDAEPDAADAEAPLEKTYPPLLSQTGLYASLADLKKDVFAAGVRPYEPKYALWSDGATKRRFIQFPAGKTIDTTEMDYWKYPVGTKVWKEFTSAGKRIETRYLFKPSADSTEWVMVAYLWREDLSDADAVPEGVTDGRGTEHDVPAQSDCDFCHHGMKDRLLGVTALQLSHDRPGMNLRTMMREGLLSAPPPAPFVVPGNDVEEQALGYLHANCGLCHNDFSPISQVATVRFWLMTGSLGSVPETTTYRSSVLQHNAYLPQWHVIEPGRPEVSELFYRVSRRGIGQMPPLGTDQVDPDGVAKVRAWIESMPPVDSADAGSLDAGR